MVTQTLDSRILTQVLPSRSLEDWRYTPLKTLESRLKAARVALNRASLVVAPPILNLDQLVFVNGVFSDHLSKVTSPNLSLLKGQADAKNASYLRKLNAEISKETVEILALGDNPRPFLIRHFFTAEKISNLYSPSVRVRLGKGSTLRLVEIFEDGSPSNFVLNDVFETEQSESSRLHHLRILNLGPDAIHTGHIQNQMFGDAEYELSVLGSGATISRTEINCDLLGERAKARFLGCSILNDERRGEINLQINHRVPRTQSFQDFRTLAFDKSHGVFQGKVKIFQDAQLSESHQISRNLILGEKAHIDAKPQLDVLANDVKATHGATVGQLEPEQLFYLQSRCLDQQQAEEILCGAFAVAVGNQITHKWERECAIIWLKNLLKYKVGPHA